MSDSIDDSATLNKGETLPLPEEVIPHRAPMLFLHVIDDCNEVGAVGRYRFDPQDPIFVGHFPERAIVPGVLLLEGAAQTLAYWALRRAPDHLVLLTGVEKAKWSLPVYPGDEVCYKVKIIKAKLGLVIADIVVSVGEQVALQARIKGYLQTS